jgi:hypothetical protein
MAGRCLRASGLELEFIPRSVVLYFVSRPPAPSAGAGVVEHLQCLASILTDSMTRYSLSALLTFPDTQ